MTDLDRVTAALAHNDPHEALVTLNRILLDSPRNMAAYRLRAQAHLRLQRRPAAIADLDEALKLAPQDESLRAQRAELLLAQRQFAAAQADCDYLLALRSEKRWHHLRGLCRVAMGDSAGALADFAAAGLENLKQQLEAELRSIPAV